VRIPTLFAVALGILFSSACAPAARPAAESPRSTAAEAPRSGSIFFWRASKKGKPGNVYLLGSVHLRGKDASLDRAITDAATKCERGAFELDLDALDPNEDARFVQSKGLLENQTLKDVVTPETFAAWTRVTTAEQLPTTMLERFRPWMAAVAMQLAILEKRGISGDHGIDKMLYVFEKQEPTKARQIIGLETSREQLQLLAGGSPRVQDLLLRSTALEIESDQLGKIITLYETGNEAAMNELLDKPRTGDPEMKPFIEAIFDHRNASMTEKIAPMVETEGCTVVTVGVGHVAGEGGIVRRLRDRGFDVERFSSRGPSSAEQMAHAVRKPKELVHREHGFSVRTSLTPTFQETPIPNSSFRSYNYVFVEGVSTVMTLAVLPIADAPMAKRIGAQLESIAKQALVAEGSEVTAVEATTVNEAKAVRARGDRRKGDVRAAQIITWTHGNRLFSLTAKSLGDGDPKKLDEQVTKLLDGFRHLD
jgi:uncharacterized protein YbaP (TraB family)